MKKNLILMTILAVVLTSCNSNKEIKRTNIVERDNLFYEVNSESPFTGIVYETYESLESEIKEVIDKNYKGNRKYSASYKNGIYHGPYTSWYSSGQIKSSGNHSNGKYEGEWEKYFKNGQIESITNYKNGIKEGKAITYYENGQFASELIYNNGMFWEIIKDFDKKGNAVNGHTLKNGYGRVIFYKNDRYSYTGIYENGVMVRKE